MLRLFCDRCGNELTDKEYRSVSIRSSLIATDKDEPVQEFAYELCPQCHDIAMSALQTAIQECQDGGP